MEQVKGAGGEEKEAKTLMRMKPKMFHILLFVLALGIAHSLVFLAHLTGLVDHVSQLSFALNIALLGLFAYSFVHLVGLNRHVYEISGSAVSEVQGIIHREKKIVPMDRIYGYRMTRSVEDHLLGTAQLKITGTGGESCLDIRDADYLDALNAEKMLEILLRERCEKGETAWQEELPEKPDGTENQPPAHGGRFMAGKHGGTEVPSVLRGRSP